ncbi:MAG: exodeoxyribonuclease VII small subunit [Candidatus Omnitrophica bacterium]|nr:exodeoxyribonuclease VII small subunit [Candidatus Omnitrophota bacterium]MCM8793094.1 exodeoxyribonuclease VII small subunit [Candidatus Omnitrophota bacterium]
MAKEGLKYSKAVEELERILQRIQDGQIDVDDLAKEVKRATELIKLCKEKIEKTEWEVKEVVKSFEENK